MNNISAGSGFEPVGVDNGNHQNLADTARVKYIKVEVKWQM